MKKFLKTKKLNMQLICQFFFKKKELTPESMESAQKILLNYLEFEATRSVGVCEVGSDQEQSAGVERVAARVVAVLDLVNCLPDAFVVFELEYVDVVRCQHFKV